MRWVCGLDDSGKREAQALDLVAPDADLPAQTLGAGRHAAEGSRETLAGVGRYAGAGQDAACGHQSQLDLGAADVGREDRHRLKWFTPRRGAVNVFNFPLSSRLMASTRPLALVTLVAATGGFLFGYDTAVINGANQYLRAHFALGPRAGGIRRGERDPRVHPRRHGRGIPRRPVRAAEGAVPLRDPLRRLRAALGAAAHVRRVPRRALHQRPGHRRLVDDHPGLHRGARTAGTARAPRLALPARHRHRHLPHAVRQRLDPGPGRRRLERVGRMAVDAGRRGGAGDHPAGPAAVRARKPAVAGAAQTGAGIARCADRRREIAPACRQDEGRFTRAVRRRASARRSSSPSA